MPDSSFSSGFINDMLISSGGSGDRYVTLRFASGSRTCPLTLLSATRHSRIYKTTYKGKILILKAANPENGDKQVSAALLQREYQILSELDNPFIIRTWGLRNDSQIGECIILDYVDGIPLDKFLELKPTHKTRLRIINELLDAVAYLHAKQIVHKDLKPSNILITTNGEHVKLIDFGFADADSQMVNNLGCTNRYASPEQLNGDTPDYRTDIYTIGKIIREIEPRRYYLTTSRCLRKDPSRRYKDVPSLAKAISRSSRLPYLLLIIALLAIGWVIGTGTVTRKRSEGSRLPVPATHPTTTDTVFIHDTIRVAPIDPAEPVINEIHRWYAKAQQKTLYRIRHLEYPQSNFPGLEWQYFNAEFLAIKRHYQTLHPEFRQQIEQDYLVQLPLLFIDIKAATDSIPKPDRYDDATKAAYDIEYARLDSTRAELDKKPKSVFQIIERR